MKPSNPVSAAAKIPIRGIRIVSFGLLAAILIWAIPVGFGMIQAKPHSGSFLIGKCACGHELFLLIEGLQAFDYCPAHKEKYLIGPALWNGDMIKVSRSKDLSSYATLKLERGMYFLNYTSIKDDDWHVVQPVSNPWRTSLRGYFPE